MSETLISRDEAIAWKRDKCTKKFMEILDDNCKMIMMNWGNKAYNSDNADATVMLTSEMLGELRAYKTLLAAIENGKAIPHVAEEANNA